MALCAALLCAKGLEFVRRHRSLASALASARHGVQEQLGGAEEAAEAAAEVAAAGAPAPAAAAVASCGGQARTPVVSAGWQPEPEVSPLIQRGEAAGSRPGQASTAAHRQMRGSAECRLCVAACPHRCLPPRSPPCRPGSE